MRSSCSCEISFTPLCSPTLLNKIGGFSKPADVLRANLLHLGDTEDWARWLALSKVENPDTEGGIFFSDMNLVFSAAIAGQGIAMGDELTSRRALSEGRLVQPVRHRDQIAALLFPGLRACQGDASGAGGVRGMAEVEAARRAGSANLRPIAGTDRQIGRPTHR